MTERFVLSSFYGYFAAFVLVEFVLTRFRLGTGERGNRDRLSALFFLFVPFAGIFLWIFCVNAHLVGARSRSSWACSSASLAKRRSWSKGWARAIAPT
ncbi:MAG TPA: hypothetical protein VFM00_03790 [Candidatus Eisenbacteria bacterium]|nr:hypothetical protein [Candidatus Eisenbacteria bacterium]